MKKKFLSLILVLILLCIFSVNVFAFPDVDETHWAKEFIDTVASAGIVKGYEDGTFLPENKVTAGEFIKMVACVLDLDYMPVVNQGEHWAYQYVKILENKIEGFDISKYDEELELDAKMPRGEMSVVLALAYSYRFSKNIDYEMGDGILFLFKDLDEIPNKYKPFINFCKLNKLLSGYEDDTFRVNNVLTRAEACKVICKLLYK